MTAEERFKRAAIFFAEQGVVPTPKKILTLLAAGQSPNSPARRRAQSRRQGARC